MRPLIPNHPSQSNPFLSMLVRVNVVEVLLALFLLSPTQALLQHFVALARIHAGIEGGVDAAVSSTRFDNPAQQYNILA